MTIRRQSRKLEGPIQQDLLICQGQAGCKDKEDPIGRNSKNASMIVRLKNLKVMDKIRLKHWTKRHRERPYHPLL